MRYFLKLAYDGSGFHGWQSQPNACSVQQTLEDALSLIYGREMKITGAGRTDTGVHARTMYAHFDADSLIPDNRRLIQSLNRLCGRGIAVHDIISVPEEAHARFDALSRTYKYFVIYSKSPFLDRSAWHSPQYLDIRKMNEAAALLLANDDFTSFAKLHSDVKTNICKVYQAAWEPYDNIFAVPGIVFTITADRFLRNMVRAVVGTLVDVGRGKIDINDFRDIIDRKDRCAAGTSMPAHALYLWDIRYPYIQ